MTNRDAQVDTTRREEVAVAIEPGPNTHTIAKGDEHQPDRPDLQSDPK